MTTVSRSQILQEGKDWWYVVECAVRTDGSSPARAFLDLLKEGMWEDDPDVEAIPDDEQIKDYERLVHSMRFVGKNGEPERKDDVNYLRDGIWEFKVASKRLAFCVTDGQGSLEVKGKLASIADSPSPRSPAWWFPAFDGTRIRLLNAWPKVGQTAGQLDIDEAIQIREEDLAHDR